MILATLFHYITVFYLQISAVKALHTAHLHLRADGTDPVTFDTSCDNAQRDLIKKAFQDAVQMASLAQAAATQTIADIAFWELFGPDAIRNYSSMPQVFGKVVQGPWAIAASCDFLNAQPQCTDRYMYGGIGEGAQKSNFQAKLVFCHKFFNAATLNYRIARGIDHELWLSTRIDLGYFSQNQGTTLYSS
jgi:hypothetical protein